MSTHTAGPWFVDGVAIRAEGSDDLARVYMPHGMTPETHEANAHLVAAAPELLSALIELTETLPDGHQCPYPDCAQCHARSAVAKAKNGQKQYTRKP